MGYQENIKILRGSQKYKGSLDKDYVLPTLLEKTSRELIQGDRNSVVNLLEQYFFEKNESSLYRFYGKITPIVYNSISGNVVDQIMLGKNTFYSQETPFSETQAFGFPSINFFDFFSVEQLTSPHGFNEPNSLKDNWLIYISYVRRSVNLNLTYYTNKINNVGITFNSRSGIPFYVTPVTINGAYGLKFTCPVNHGLSVGDTVVLQNDVIPFGGVGLISEVNGSNSPTVYSLGDEFLGTEKNVFTVLLRGDLTYNGGDVGVFRRQIDPQNIESLSNYYIHEHELITNSSDYTLDRCGFEFGVYSKRERFFPNEFSPPLGQGHSVVKEQIKSYLWNFNRDIDVLNYFDNLGRELTDVYLTVLSSNQPRLWKRKGENDNLTVGIGYSWNFVSDGLGNDPYHEQNFEPNLQTPFVLPQSGDTFLGAFVEYNPYDLKERVVSEIYHKLSFSENIMNDGSGQEINGGYYYQPHHRYPIKKVSETITEYNNYTLVPNYATYSEFTNTWRWRNILDIGVFESDNSGIDYPFVNGHHYPYLNSSLLISPILSDGLNRQSGSIIPQPNVDVCE